MTSYLDANWDSGSQAESCPSSFAPLQQRPCPLDNFLIARSNLQVSAQPPGRKTPNPRTYRKSLIPRAQETSGPTHVKTGRLTGLPDHRPYHSCGHRCAARTHRHAHQATNAACPAMARAPDMVDALAVEAKHRAGRGVGSGLESYSEPLTFSAKPRVMPGTAAMSSTGASRTPWTEPKRRRRAFLRTGPMPPMSSIAEATERLDLTLRW